MARSSYLRKSLLYTFKQFRSEGFDSVMLKCETKCTTLNITPGIERKLTGSYEQGKNIFFEMPKTYLITLFSI